MTWQEYQEAVARLYEQAEGIGDVKRNVFVRVWITGQPRQIDVLIEVETNGRVMRIPVDAKFRQDRLDVKDIEEVPRPLQRGRREQDGYRGRKRLD